MKFLGVHQLEATGRYPEYVATVGEFRVELSFNGADPAAPFWAASLWAVVNGNGDTELCHAFGEVGGEASAALRDLEAKVCQIAALLAGLGGAS